MRVSVGIFAHNEVQHIGTTLESLFNQTIIDDESGGLQTDAVEVLVLANGCTDDTADVAMRQPRNLARQVTYSVIEMPEPGKSRTWNRFVHELSDPSADFLILMDADIVFERNDVLEQLLSRLRANVHAQVATDTPVKAFVVEDGKLSVSDRASSAASKQLSKEGVLCGQLYCARAEALRSIWLPPALPVEDGYLAAMIKTGGFTGPEDSSRIAWVSGARHSFRTHRSVSGYIAHEARIIVGSTINSWLFTDLWTQGRKGHAGSYVARKNSADPDWLSNLVQAKVRNSGAWLIPMHFIFWRLAPLKGQPLLRKLRRAPIALMATALNFLACVRANSLLKRRDATSYW